MKLGFSPKSIVVCFLSLISLVSCSHVTVLTIDEIFLFVLVLQSCPPAQLKSPSLCSAPRPQPALPSPHQRQQPVTKTEAETERRHSHRVIHRHNRTLISPRVWLPRCLLHWLTHLLSYRLHSPFLSPPLNLQHKLKHNLKLARKPKHHREQAHLGCGQVCLALSGRAARTHEQRNRAAVKDT